MKKFKSSKNSSSSSKKVKYTFNTKSDVIMEDKTSPKAIIKIIFNKDEPFYKHIFKKEDANGTSNF